jgi:diketogulonate reductase-like aldo/keto reductase
MAQTPQTDRSNATPAPQFLYGTAWKEDRTAHLVESAVRNGFRGFDTANQRKHYFEAGVGEGLAAAYRAGLVTRPQLFLQTKFTYMRGQDKRLPYNPASPHSSQVEQSLTSSLEHLQTEYVDSFLLHGPSSGTEWGESDAEVWQAMQSQLAAGRTRQIGVSNISLRQLEQMSAQHGAPPAFVQNRCYAQLGWDREVRAFCKANGVVYQGFSLLTANLGIQPFPFLAAVSRQHQATFAQTIFAFARGVGMLPLTGTTDAGHMREDLASLDIALTEDEIVGIESLLG